VDITEQEKNKDFAHKKLIGKHHLGTVGLWIGLHGESILQTGMHHLEARFEFPALCRDLKKKNRSFMPPFSNFPFLKQAFSRAELWNVNKRRADNLLKKKLITLSQHATFLRKGALGSHLENLQRKQGFKGFNQSSVTVIIQATDPRKQYREKAA